METLIPIRAPAFELQYNGKSITADVANSLLSVSYTDHLEGESDELDIELEDASGIWLDRWYPEKGCSLTFRMGYQGEKLVSAGVFDLDQIEYSAPPSVVRLRALATGLQHPVRTLQGRSYEKTTLQEIARKVALRHKMKLVGKFGAVPIDRATQFHETDLDFLRRLSGQYGYAFKVTENNTKLVFWKTVDLFTQLPIATLGLDKIKTFQGVDKVGSVPAVSMVRYHNHKTRLNVTASSAHSSVQEAAHPVGKTTSSDTRKRVVRAPDTASAKLQVDADLDRQRLEKIEVELELIGNPVLCAGAMVQLTGVGQFSGLYLINRATHRISRGTGYSTALQLKRQVAR